MFSLLSILSIFLYVRFHGLGFIQLFSMAPNYFADWHVSGLTLDFLPHPFGFSITLIYVFLHVRSVIKIPRNNSFDLGKRQRWKSLVNIRESITLLESGHERVKRNP